MTLSAFEKIIASDYELFDNGFKRFQEKLLSLHLNWDEFTKTGRIQGDIYLQPEVFDSWIRSRDWGIDPFNNTPIAVSQAELSARLEKNKVLCEVCEACVTSYMNSLKGTGFRVDLFDTDLILIKQFGEEANIKIANEQGTYPGVTREEKLVGTTAGALAKQLMRPIQTVGPEHYKMPFHYWTCSAAPIQLNDGTLLGILNLSGYFVQAHEHTLGMTIAITKAIEYCYSQNQIRMEIEITKKYVDGIINTISDGIIATDTEGNIQIMNKRAGHILQVVPADLMNKCVRGCYERQSSIIKTLDDKTKYYETELVFIDKKKQISVFGSIMPVGENNKNTGALAIFKSMKSARGFVQNIAGFKAFFTFEDIITNNPIMLSIKSLARQAARLDFNILLQGASGTGKELFAQAIHNDGSNPNGPFVSINCAAIPNELLESELFGYEYGAFTGAIKGGKPGKFQLAECGTVFLDEINSLPIDMQVKLLRVLQNKTFMRIGGIQEISLKAKIISASNKNLLSEVRKGNFREDLYYRLNVVDIYLPPLSEHKDDIPLYVERFLARVCEKLGVTITIASVAMEVLLSYDWPGNIRELENFIEKGVVSTLAKGNSIIESETFLKCTESVLETSGTRYIQNKSLAINERIVIESALNEAKGNKSKAAALLGITRRTLYKKIERLKDANC